VTRIKTIIDPNKGVYDVPGSLGEPSLSVDSGHVIVSGERLYLDPTVPVKSVADLPAPVSGVITLGANTGYKIIGTVPVGATQIVIPQGSLLCGGSFSTSALVSTYTGSFVKIDAPGATELRDLSLVNKVGGLLSYNDAGGPGGLVLNRVLFDGGGVEINNAGVVFAAQCSLPSSSKGFLFRGNVQDVLVEALGCSLFEGSGSSSPAIHISSSAVIEAFRLVGGVFDLGTVQHGLVLDTTSSVSNGLVWRTHFRGSGSYTTGLDKTTPQWKFKGVVGVFDSITSAEADYVVSSPATFTNPGVGTYGEVPGSFGVSSVERFEYISGSKFRYIAPVRISVHVNGSITGVPATSAAEVALGYSLNGNVVSGSSLVFPAGSRATGTLRFSRIVEMEENDEIELAMSNLETTGDINVFSAEITVVHIGF
jgi:hypothetical protein